MALPTTIKKAVIQKISSDIFESISVITVPLPTPKPDEVLIKNRYIGINASDLNACVGHGVYDNKDPPFDLGLEGVGEIVQLGSNVQNFHLNQPVVYISHNAHAEYSVLPVHLIFPIPEINPEYLALLISGTSSAIGLDQNGQIKSGETVLVTAAAGGTGHLTVQWAKNAGCHVIGTCSSTEKVNFLKSIGCDRPINYKEEDLNQVLTNEYPEGVDVIWETVGGEILEILYKHLAFKGRLIFVGATTSYKSDNIFPPFKIDDFSKRMLYKSLTISGFFLRNCAADLKQYFIKLMTLYKEKKLKVKVDMGTNSKDGEFLGVEFVPRALEFLRSGQNTGKVIIKL